VFFLKEAVLWSEWLRRETFHSTRNPVTFPLPLHTQYSAIPSLTSKECARIMDFNEKECEAIEASVLALYTQLAAGENINNNKVSFRVDTLENNISISLTTDLIAQYKSPLDDTLNETSSTAQRGEITFHMNHESRTFTLTKDINPAQKKINFLQPKHHTPNPKLLNALLKVTQSTHKILDLDKLLEIIVADATQLIDCDGSSVILYTQQNQELYFHTVLDPRLETQKKLQGLKFSASNSIAGRIIATKQAVIIADVHQDNDFNPNVDNQTGAQTSSLMYAPIMIRERVIGILSAQNKKVNLFCQQDLEALSALSGAVALAIDNARSHKAIKHGERIKKELESARLMQQATLPQTLPDITGLSISALCQPAVEVGGDYYDVLPLSEGSYGIAIGDVSGHGLEAGMMVSMSRSCLYTLSNFPTTLTQVMSAMNRMVYGGVKKRLIMTFFFGIYDPKKRKLTFSNAGHPPPFFYSAKHDRWSTIEDSEFPLGVIEEHLYQSHTIDLQPGDTLVFFSDGIIEGCNKGKQQFGMKRLQTLLATEAGTSAQQIKTKIWKTFSNFCEGQAVEDDSTLLVVTVNKD